VEEVVVVVVVVVMTLLLRFNACVLLLWSSDRHPGSTGRPLLQMMPDETSPRTVGGASCYTGRAAGHMQ